MLKSKSAAAAWLDTLELIKTNGRTQLPRGKETLEVLHHSICVDMVRPVVSFKERELSYKFLAAEALWITSGDDTVGGIAPWNKKIADFSDDGETFFGAYGPKISEQWEYVLCKLIEDRDTRQAVLTIWRENPQPTKDYPCTIAMAFQIRGSSLNAHVFMRSSDVWLGLPYDIFNFSMIALKLACEYNDQIKPEYKVDLGNLYLTMASSHLYAVNFEKAQGPWTFQSVNTLPCNALLEGNWEYYQDSLISCRNAHVDPDRPLWRIRP